MERQNIDLLETIISGQKQQIKTKEAEIRRIRAQIRALQKVVDNEKFIKRISNPLVEYAWK